LTGATAPLGAHDIRHRSSRRSSGDPRKERDAAIGRGRRLARETVRELAENWSFIAGMIGVALYATALIMQKR